VSDSTELVTLKTRVPREVADRLSELASLEDRSLAAEIRRAIDRHLSNSDARKDGRK
jgi:predicted DNA-binding protein